MGGMYATISIGWQSALSPLSTYIGLLLRLEERSPQPKQKTVDMRLRGFSGRLRSWAVGETRSIHLRTRACTA